jgi:hypothetical protein
MLTVTVAAAMVAAWAIASLPFGILLGLTLYFSAMRLSRPKSIALTLAVATVIGTTVAYSAFAVVTQLVILACQSGVVTG